MEEEGLKDEEVLKIEIFFLDTQHSRLYLILFSKLLALVHGGRVLAQ